MIYRISLSIIFVWLSLTSLVPSAIFGQVQSNGKLEVAEIQINRNGGSAAVSTIFCMGIDGFPWYTTANGIVKYYGVEEMTHSFSPPPEELGPNPSRDIYQSRDGSVWVATSLGLYQFSEETLSGRWLQLSNPNTKEALGFTSIYETSDGTMLFTTNSQYVVRYNSKSDSLLPIKLDDDLYVTPVSTDDFDSYRIKFQNRVGLNGVILTQFDKVLKFENDAITFIKSYESLRDQLADGAYLKVIPDGAVMPLRTSGFYSHNDKKYPFDVLSSIESQVLVLPSQRFQVLTESGLPDMQQGVVVSEIDASNSAKVNFYVLDREKKKLNSILKPVTFQRSVQRIFSTSDAPIYISTLGGAFKLKYKQLPFKTLLTSDQLPIQASRVSVRGMAQKENGNILFATYGGLYEMDSNEQVSMVDLPLRDQSNKLLNLNRSLYVENDSILWNLGETRRLLRINLNTRVSTPYILEGENEGRLLTSQKLVATGSDQFFIGTNKGLFVFDRISKEVKEMNDILPGFDLAAYTIKDIYLDEKNRYLLLATSSDGLLYKNLESGLVVHFSPDDKIKPFPARTIYVIHKGHDGSYYLGTDAGLVILNSDLTSWEHYDKADGIANNTVVGILEDDIGVWLSTFGGLTCYHKIDDWFYNFYEKDGLPENEFNQTSYFKSKSDALFFGGLNGVAYFTSADLTFKKSDAQIKIVSAQFYDDEKEEVVTETYNVKRRLDNLVLPYSKTFLNISFAITDLFNAEEATYEYKLEGLNPNWIDLGASNSLQLNALSPGEYILRLRGDDSSGSPTVNEITIPIKVEQVFYKTTWFLLLNIAGIALMLIGFYEFRKYRWKEKYRQQRQVDQLEAKALRAQMNPHFMFNALNGLQSTMILKGEKEANKYLGSFSKLLRSSLDMSRTDTISLSEEIEYLEAYLSLEKIRQARSLETVITIDPEDLDIASIQIPCMLFQPIVENAIIHGLAPKRDGEAKIEIKFKEENGHLIGSITDNGIGRKAAIALKAKNRKTHKSWATKILKERIEIINRYTNKNVNLQIIDLYEGDISIGTRVILKLPLN
ncbi:hypothetical protein EAX61_05525 [Dokdonia sinensis]|uniref:Signal transduction histidine kinase internal region domain-containing protein n=1 Tax=Dokdonia sinensis TaxID=2479847 RepID=A0A3M0GH82_9FLAO|nr:histidine kinase [Dokdonia sinensis]RMB60943.1 hypothetical protein EAX61_05525 [Dokdonia sinensis]